MMKRWRQLLGVLLWFLAPWVATATLFFGTRGQWLSALGCCLAGGALAALGLDTALWSQRDYHQSGDLIQGDQERD